MLLVLVTMFSCTSEELDFPQSEASVEQSNENLITAEQASQYALDFVNKINKATRTSDFSLRVESVKAIGENKKNTRSGNVSGCDSLFYIVNFADNNGFVIVSTDKNDTHVYGYVEQGTYDEDDTTDSGFSDYMSSIIASRKNMASSSFADVGGNGGILSSVESEQTQTEVMLPLLKSKWSQKYNLFCPKTKKKRNDACLDPERCPTGCVPTAISQICTFLEKPEEVTYIDESNKLVSCKMDWERIYHANCVTSTGFTSDRIVCSQICHLMRYWGIQLEAKYYDDYADVNREYAIIRMQSLASKLGCEVTSLRDFNVDNIISDLKQGNKIIYARGSMTKNSVGHAWVIDGYIREIEEGGVKKYLHCNWGRGGFHNGFFLCTDFDYDQFPIYDDYGKKTRTAFRYDLKTSTISKRKPWQGVPSAPKIIEWPKDDKFLANTSYCLIASNALEERILEYEWIIKNRNVIMNYEKEGTSVSFVTGKLGTIHVEVRARNDYGWSDYTVMSAGITTDRGSVILQ